jgi:hypothetical protein
MADPKITFDVLFETKVARDHRGRKYLEPLHYNEFVNMIVVDKTWPYGVSFVTANATQGRLVSRDWTRGDFPAMIELLVARDYTVTITDVDTWEVIKTPKKPATEEQNAAVVSDIKGKKRHADDRHAKRVWREQRPS